MSRQEQIQPRRQRSREESVSTFPERTVNAGGNPEGADDMLAEIDRQFAEQDRLRRLGHIATEASK